MNRQFQRQNQSNDLAKICYWKTENYTNTKSYILGPGIIKSNDLALY